MKNDVSLLAIVGLLAVILGFVIDVSEVRLVGWMFTIGGQVLYDLYWIRRKLETL